MFYFHAAKYFMLNNVKWGKKKNAAISDCISHLFVPTAILLPYFIYEHSIEKAIPQLTSGPLFMVEGATPPVRDPLNISSAPFFNLT